VSEPQATNSADAPGLLPSPTEALALFERYFFTTAKPELVAVRVEWQPDKKKPCPADQFELATLANAHVAGGRAKVRLRVPGKDHEGKRITRLVWKADSFRLGAYYLDAQNCVRWICLDFDADGGDHSSPLKDATAAMRECMATCAELGVPAHVERSGRGKGWHVWVFLSEAVHVGRARTLGLYLAPRGHLLANGKVAEPEGNQGIEVFPKQEGKRKTPVGNLVWLPWWKGAAPGGNLFYRPGAAGELEPYLPTEFETMTAVQLEAAIERAQLRRRAEPAAPSPPAAAQPARPPPPRGPAAPDLKAWKSRMLDALRLEDVYGPWLTGRDLGDWLECRDPRSGSGDQNPSAGVATGKGEAQRGRFHSHITNESFGIIDFLIQVARRVPDEGSAMRLLADLSGVPLPPRRPLELPPAAHATVQTQTTVVSEIPPLESPAWLDLAPHPVELGAPTVQLPDPPHTADDLEAKAPPEIPKRYRPLTDAGNAERLSMRHGKDLRYVAPLDSWFIWDGTRWKRDQTQEIVRRAIETARHIEDDVQLVEPAQKNNEKDKERYDNEVAAIRKWAKATEAAARISAMISLAGASRHLSAMPGDFDRDGWLLNLPNGTLNLRTREIQPHRRENLISRIAMVPFDPSAKAPRWEQFLAEIFQKDKQLIEFVRRAIAYTLTGSDREQCFFICWGPEGQNGKGRLFNVMLQLAGAADNDKSADEGYAVTMNIDSLSRRDAKSVGGDKARPDLVQLRGARLVTTSEQNEEVTLDEALLKQLTGGDPISPRGLYEKSITFRPVCKIWLSVNHKPKARESGNGFWRRVKMLPFLYKVPESKKDPELDAKLNAELSGILNWTLSGLEDWMEKGLGTAESIEATVKEYRWEMNQVGRFIEECCYVGEHMFSPAGDLYEAYRAWCQRVGEHPMTQNSLGRKLTELGHPLKHDTEGANRLRNGLGLKSSAPSAH
jgi:P4 family phage/plasmid primase-like protien